MSSIHLYYCMNIESAPFNGFTDKQLLDSFKESPHRIDFWNALFMRYLNYLYDNLCKWLSQDIARECVQELYLKFYKIALANEVRNVKGWISNVLYYYILDKLKPGKNILGLETLLNSDINIEKNNPFIVLKDKEKAQGLYNCLKKLKEQDAVQHTAICMRYMEEIASVEIAKVLHLSISTVGYHLIEGRKKLKTCLEIRWRM